MRAMLSALFVICLAFDKFVYGKSIFLFEGVAVFLSCIFGQATVLDNFCNVQDILHRIVLYLFINLWFSLKRVCFVIYWVCGSVFLPRNGFGLSCFESFALLFAVVLVDGLAALAYKLVQCLYDDEGVYTAVEASILASLEAVEEAMQVRSEGSS